MKKILSFLCSLAFCLSGGMLAITASSPSSRSDSYKMMNAANRPVMQLAANPVLPQDLLLDLAKKQSVQDTVFITKTDTIKEQVTKVKWKKVAVPSPVIDVTVTSQCRIDTVEKPVYYIATQSGNKEGPDGSCISVYEVHRVDEICPEIANSSIDVDVGD